MTMKTLAMVCAVLALGDVRAVPAASRPHGAASAKKGGARCGNKKVEAGETCDDGNTKDGDYCPSNCRIEYCKPTNERFEVAVTLDHPPGVAAGGVVVLLDYPEGAVSLPGSGGEPTVRERISNVPKDFMSSPFDLDYALRAVIAMARELPPGELFHASFDRCEGVAPPEAKDFRCTVEQVAGPGGKTLPSAGFSCSVKTL
jgi:cysteine-rich repeat protein